LVPKKERYKIVANTGQMTHELANILMLNQFLRESNDPNQNKKNRDDHRHHLIDAFIVSMMNQQTIVAIPAARKHRGTDAAVKILKLPFDSLKEVHDYVRDMLDKAKVLHKTKHRIRGPLHQETHYRIKDGGICGRVNPVDHILKKTKDGKTKKPINYKNITKNDLKDRLKDLFARIDETVYSSAIKTAIKQNFTEERIEAVKHEIAEEDRKAKEEAKKNNKKEPKKSDATLESRAIERIFARLYCDYGKKTHTGNENKRIRKVRCRLHGTPIFKVKTGESVIDISKPVKFDKKARYAANEDNKYLIVYRKSTDQNNVGKKAAPKYIFEAVTSWEAQQLIQRRAAKCKELEQNRVAELKKAYPNKSVKELKQEVHKKCQSEADKALPMVDKNKYKTEGYSYQCLVRKEDTLAVTQNGIEQCFRVTGISNQAIKAFISHKQRPVGGCKDDECVINNKGADFRIVR